MRQHFGGSSSADAINGTDFLEQREVDIHLEQATPRIVFLLHVPGDDLRYHSVCQRYRTFSLFR